METPNIDKLNSFDMENIPELDTAVLGTLELFQQKPLPRIDVSSFGRPLVVGSGGAEAASRIMFEKADAVFASESNVDEKLANIPAIDSVVLISASGKKHAPIIVDAAKKAAKKVTLITNTPSSPASELLDENSGDSEFVLPKNREPYTYNTSTYMGMIMGVTGESPAEVKRFIDDCTSKLDSPDFSKYNKYYLMVPTKFLGVIRLLELKFIELFGRNIARDVETIEYARLHATTVVPSDELFISFGEKNEIWGEPENRFFVPLPEGCDYGAMMAIGYYTVGQIQKAYPHYFKDNIQAYCDKVSELSGNSIRPIVEV